MRYVAIFAFAFSLALLVSAFAQDERSAPGGDQSAKSRALEAGAAAIQARAPVDAINIHLSGFHPLKDDPAHQMEASHFCNQLNQDFAQCVLFDGEGSEARMNGIEYIISEQLFNQLPAAERQYWHPHNYEILSGQLIGPGLPAAAEKQLMRDKMNSYGKTWHTWMTNPGDPGKLPLGEARLAWSFNQDGEARPELTAERDRRLGLDTAAKRAERADLAPLAKPQQGADALRGQFPSAKKGGR
jgi:hypothetical protein